MKKNNQLNLHQRYQIEALLETGISKSEIAEIIKVVPCNVYRELGRTTVKYVAANAQKRADARHKSKPKQVLLTDSD